MATYPEPTWTTPSDQYVQRVSAFTEDPCPFALISSLIIRYLQMHFSSADTIMNKGLKTLLWTDDVKTSKLFIGSGQADNTRNASQKAAVFVNREDIKPLDMYIPPSIARVSINGPATGPGVWNKLVSGTTTVRCDSRMASEAELLSEEIFHLLLLFLPAIQEDGHIETFDVAVTKTGRTESGIFSSTVAVSWNVRTRYINDEEVAY